LPYYSCFSDGLLKVYDEDNKVFFMDKTGHIAITIKGKFKYIWEFHDGLALVESGNGYGFIDKNGKVVVDPKYSRADGFKNGLAIIEVNKKVGYINKLGQIVVQPQFDDARDFYEEMAVVRCGSKYGFIDARGIPLF
jgi:hypothetical protein